jgi:glycosyltransferase involved in cell wall biosynthesis
MRRAMHAHQRHHGSRTSALRGLSVVICADSARHWDALVATVAAVEDRHPAPEEVLVVIDHDDELLELALHGLPEARVLANEERRGLFGARNTGLRHACGDTIAFVDPLG